MRKLLIQVRRMYAQMFYIPSAEVLALRELEEAKRSLLEMQTAKDYATRLVEYNQDRVKRLTNYLNKATEAKGDDK
jgi:hypothetical protein